MKIAVVTDSTAYLTKEEYAEYGIYVIADVCYFRTRNLS